jgi:hypothetical protein
VDDARGASALINAVRTARVLNNMTKEEAKLADVDNCYTFFRINDGKANNQVRSDKSTWRRLISVQLGNGKQIKHAGDEVGVVTHWEWPAADEDITAEEKATILAKIESDEWYKSPRAEKWVGNAVIEALGLNASLPEVKAKTKGIVEKWITSGVLHVVRKNDKKRMPKDFVEVRIKKVRAAA